MARWAALRQTRQVPSELVDAVLEQTGATERRLRTLPVVAADGHGAVRAPLWLALRAAALLDAEDDARLPTTPGT